MDEEVLKELSEVYKLLKMLSQQTERTSSILLGAIKELRLVESRVSALEEFCKNIQPPDKSLAEMRKGMN